MLASRSMSGHRFFPALVAALLASACGASPAPELAEAPPVIIAEPPPPAPAAASDPAAVAESEPDPEPEGASAEPAPGASPAPPPPSPWLAGPNTPSNNPITTNPAQIGIQDPVYYQTGSDQIKPESLPTLSRVAAYLRAKPEVSLLRIEVHTDSQGDAQANQKLSERRALSVGRWLVANGIDCKRLLPVGFGENKPIAPNTTAEGRARNRRTEFLLAALRGRPFGGMPVDGGGKYAGDVCH